MMRSTRPTCVAVCLFAVCISARVAAQTQPVDVEPAPSGLEPGEPMNGSASADDFAAQMSALRAEIETLKAKQEEAEAAALLNQDATPAQAENEMLRVYGFMDFGLDKYFLSSNDGLTVLRPTSATTFVFGNLNLYFDANPVEHLRAMIELRLTLAPNGEETELGPPLGMSYQRIDTTAYEYSDPSAQSALRLGGLYIERAWSEYQFSSLFKLQWGLFLNPFGIWNLDHGSPTLISLMLPEFIASQMMPTRLLGVHLHGSAFFGSSELGYAVHVTNGRSPIDFDFTEDKAIGARLYYANEADYGRFVVGTSGYFGRYVDQERQYVPNAGSFFELRNVIDYLETVVGFDVALDVGALRVRSEAVLRWVNYDGDKSEPAITQEGTIGYLPNRLEYAGYVLAAYRTPWHIEPYIEAELAHKSNVVPRWAGRGVSGESSSIVRFLSAGFNIELTTHTLLKAQFVWDYAYKKDTKLVLNDCPIIFTRVVTSF
jgi:hypothetical protein